MKWFFIVLRQIQIKESLLNLIPSLKSVTKILAHVVD